MNLRVYLDNLVSEVLADVSGNTRAKAIVKQAARAEFGHYQANGVMGVAKQIKTNPRELAIKIVEQLTSSQYSWLERAEVAGPGFINLYLTDAFLASSLIELGTHPRLGSDADRRQKYVIDYSSPNLAKEMHIGHLRPTTIGDTIVRILEFQGQDVVRANHVGDWGAQFGSLLAYMETLDDNVQTELKDLERFYQAASKLFAEDPEFAQIARQNVVRLQQGDPQCLKLWRQFIDESIRHCQQVYQDLNITLSEKDIVPESFYNNDLATVVNELTESQLLVESDGAKCVFLDEFTGKEGKPLPAIVQKSDGGFPYMATDLAAVRYRSQKLKADRVYYFVGAEQQLHLRQVFAVATAAGYINEGQIFQHFPSGSINGPDGRRFKTREGNNVKLADVLAESRRRALDLVTEKNPELDLMTREQIANVVGIGAIKYAELSKNRMTDYTFDWNAMLSFEGNTAPYLQYAYTRIKSIFRRESLDNTSFLHTIKITESAERTLALKLLQFPEAINAVLDDCQPNLLCNYLFELSGNFMKFYEACPVLKAEQDIRSSRLGLCQLTATTLARGLHLLGIETVDQM